MANAFFSCASPPLRAGGNNARRFFQRFCSGNRGSLPRLARPKTAAFARQGRGAAPTIFEPFFRATPTITLLGAILISSSTASCRRANIFRSGGIVVVLNPYGNQPIAPLRQVDPRSLLPQKAPLPQAGLSPAGNTPGTTPPRDAPLPSSRFCLLLNFRKPASDLFFKFLRGVRKHALPPHHAARAQSRCRAENSIRMHWD